jgi:hypothetical protein
VFVISSTMTPEILDQKLFVDRHRFGIKPNHRLLL